jgi:hypothetical protein
MSEAPDREADLADHPGRPRGRDEVDPELLVLPRPRVSIRPLLALSVLVLCVYFLVRLRSDLVFAHAGPDPAEVNGIAGALAAEVDSYVELTAVPDRAAILRVHASEARDGHRLAPVLGSGDRLWLLFGGNHWIEPPTYDERVRGRVKRLGDLPFHDELAAQLDRTRLPRALDPRAALAALAAGETLARDIAGDPVALRADTPVTVIERAVGEARVTGFATDRQPDENAWRAAFERAGIVAARAPLESRTDATWSFRVPAPDGVEPLAARLVAARLFAARAEPIERTHRGAWGDLRMEGGDLLLAGGGGAAERVRAAGVAAVLVEAARRAPADARVLVLTDRPDDYQHVTPLYALLGVLALVFAWALWRGLRPEREPGAATGPAMDDKGESHP